MHPLRQETSAHEWLLYSQSLYAWKKYFIVFKVHYSNKCSCEYLSVSCNECSNEMKNYTIESLFVNHFISKVHQTKNVWTLRCTLMNKSKTITILLIINVDPCTNLMYQFYGRMAGIFLTISISCVFIYLWYDENQKYNVKKYKSFQTKLLKLNFAFLHTFSFPFYFYFKWMDTICAYATDHITCSTSSFVRFMYYKQQVCQV